MAKEMQPIDTRMAKPQGVEAMLIGLRLQKSHATGCVPELYDVEAKRLNGAVKNNPYKFANGCFFVLQNAVEQQLVEIYYRKSDKRN